MAVNHTVSDNDAEKLLYLLNAFLCIGQEYPVCFLDIFVCPTFSYVSAYLQRACLRLRLDDLARNSSSFRLNVVIWFALRVKNESNFDPVSLYMCILTGFDALVSHPKVTMTASNSVPSGIVSSDIRIIYHLPILSPSAPTQSCGLQPVIFSKGRMESLISWRCDSLGEHAWSLLPNDAFMRFLLYTVVTATPPIW